jgi:hypothetical protein
MNLIKWIGKYKDQVPWFFLTGVASFLPTILRFVVSTFYNISPFDIKDVLFAGIAFNLSNFSIVSVKDFPEKSQIIFISLFPLLIITTILALFLADEGNKNAVFHIWPFSLGVVLSLSSGYYCYSVNELIVKKFI